MTSIADRLRERNVRTIYIHIDTAELRDDPPTEGAESWLPFTIQRVNQQQLQRDGMWLVYAEHELEQEGRKDLKAAQMEEAAHLKDLTPDERMRRRQPAPTPDTEASVVRTYLADRANVMVTLLEGMVSPAYAEVKDVIKPYERTLVTAIVNFSGAPHDPKAPRASLPS
ncbi:hypothetical protein EHF33_20710 (plasmid) [Deinococcus psychrotolerans]|uniref:Uncharacterized protein n=1 Tax=Deinococcus psychrotolerans TaxID=2489213 RepID=A0A3G8YS31_9DEIO|nr:hypothetical protein [Deinococcus psychrotolerans]AZI45334.1 hypothetical protein EHF33_20710 [Deinococcus psychrotolerans]